MSLAPEIVYQATDLARRHREVVDTARRAGGATIRDKDGEALLLTAAYPVQRDRYILDGLRAAVTVLGLHHAQALDEPLLYGPLAWLAALPHQDQTTFVWEYVRALQAAEGTGISPVEQLLYEWQQTARVWADQELRADLISELPHPLIDVEL